jgi:predicted nucleic acid-binding protein
VLDSEGLAKAVRRAREVTQWLALALADDLRVITSAATVVEVAHPRLNRPALEWTLSRVVVEPVTEPIARRATAILAEAGLHGHRHAIDAMLSATALAAPGPVTVLTSDPEDIATLCGRNVTIIKVLREARRCELGRGRNSFGAQITAGGVRAVRFQRRPSKLSASLLAAERRLVARSGWSIRLFVDEGLGFG